jgi:YHYH protein
MYGATSVTSDGTYVTLVSDGIPKSKSVYYALTHPLYELFSGKTFGGYTFKKNPNTIAEGGVFTMKIPLNPKVATTHQKTSLGAIGMAVDGVPFFNQYAGPNKPLTDEMQSFDQNDGHPERSGHYHYHVEPLAITKEKGTDALMGFLLDGFPVYGTYENGKKITNADLDNYHGHSHVTPDYPNGIYHYHITDEVPYLNGDGYYGTPGTLSQK